MLIGKIILLMLYIWMYVNFYCTININVMINYKIEYCFFDEKSFFSSNSKSPYIKFWEKFDALGDIQKARITKELYPNIYKYNSPLYVLKDNIDWSYQNNFTSFPDSSYYWFYDDYSKIDTKNILFGTYYIQNIIWNHQHPKSCYKKKYIYLHKFHAGLGAELFVYASMMSYAFLNDRIAIWDPLDNYPWTSSKQCADKTFNCVFEPLSNCTPNKNSDIDKRIPKSIKNKVSNRVNSIEYYVPNFAKKMLEKSPIINSAHQWYWRAQALIYICRPNTRTLNILKQLKEENSQLYEKILNKTCDLSIYIRHGDKHKLEMTLISDENYYKLYKIIINSYNISKKSVFIVTQDHRTISYLKSKHMNINYINFSRKNGDEKFFHKSGYRILILSLLEIWLMGNTHYFITTQRSNFDQWRFILQSTVGFHQNMMNFEVGDLDCLTAPHCQLLNQQIDFLW